MCQRDAAAVGGAQQQPTAGGAGCRPQARAQRHCTRNRVKMMGAAAGLQNHGLILFIAAETRAAVMMRRRRRQAGEQSAAQQLRQDRRAARRVRVTCANLWLPRKDSGGGCTLVAGTPNTLPSRRQYAGCTAALVTCSASTRNRSSVQFLHLGNDEGVAGVGGVCDAHDRGGDVSAG